MRPFISYRGGKSRIAKKIVEGFPSHKKYVEPMIGGGSVFFAKKSEGGADIISDIDKSLMNFYKTLKSGEIKSCDLTPNHNKLAKIRVKRKQGKVLSGCEYLYLNKLSFGGTGTSYSKGAFERCKGVDAKKCGIKSKNIDDYQKRMVKTKVETGDFRKAIEKHDSKDTLFYLDPPYAGTNRGGYVDKSLQPEQIKKAVDKIKGKFVLSYNNTSQNRTLFCKKYKCRKIKTKYTMSDKGIHSTKKELLIKNF